jgi:hypothetical protein
VKTGLVVPQEHDTRQREIDAARNPEGAQGQEAAKTAGRFSLHRPALTTTSKPFSLNVVLSYRRFFVRPLWLCAFVVWFF